MTEHTYAFYLGHQPDLSQAEILCVLGHERISVETVRRVGSYVIIGTQTPVDAPRLMSTLGGTRLIGEKVAPVGNAENTIFEYLSTLPSDKKLHFSISGGKHADNIALAVKKQLKKIGRSVRYVNTINTASILHNGLVERASHMTIIDNVVYVTRAIQPIEEMTERDYGRPQPDGFNGMLPPKLARMMVNLTMPEKDSVLLDPFCGSGTLLGEAISLGLKKVIGSDLSRKAVEDTAKNLDWLQKNVTTTPSEVELLHLDVRDLGDEIEHGSVDMIATEPLMGVPRRGREARQFLVEQSRELASLYIDAFTAFHKILKPGGMVVFVIPRFRYEDDWVTMNCAEDIKKLGFELISYGEGLGMPLLYARDGQHVGREIWRFKKSA